MTDTVNIGFIGSGGNARAHMRHVRAVPDSRIVATCDIVEEQARSAAADVGAEAYTDYRRLLDHPDLHAIYISVPVFVHGEIEFAAIERGIPFLVEKPVAMDMPMAREIERRVQEKGHLTAVGYQLRYGGTVDLAREILAGEAIGLANGRYWCGTGAGDPAHWVRQMAKSGGQLVEQATHTVDMMRYLAGEISEVYCASTNQVLKEIDCPDFNAVSLKFENGAVGSLTTSWATNQGWNNANVVDILFRDALMHWTYSKLTVYQGGEAIEHPLPSPTIDEVFINAVRTGDGSAIRSPYSDAVTTLAVTLAMNRSARENRPVRISEMG